MRTSKWYQSLSCSPNLFGLPLVRAVSCGGILLHLMWFYVLVAFRALCKELTPWGFYGREHAFPIAVCSGLNRSIRMCWVSEIGFLGALHKVGATQ